MSGLATIRPRKSCHDRRAGAQQQELQLARIARRRVAGGGDFYPDLRADGAGRGLGVANGDPQCRPLGVGDGHVGLDPPDHLADQPVIVAPPVLLGTPGLQQFT
ncbi:MAG: hypothetical protein KAV00_06670, partial [Phycisphaerae bacterium]|nr:hypothetical protein [Phycisphaerae bacterium]